MIQVEHLTKRFGQFTAVEHVSFSVGKGLIFGFPRTASRSTKFLPLEIVFPPVQYLAMSKVAQIEAELGNLSQKELREVRDWLDDAIEDELEFAPEFESAIQQSEREMSQNLRPRTRQP